ncbi:GGDEF domain-containing protein [Sporosarcina limicola]|uniref:Diguanylate cyclase (GGDEF)-like protein n=1 Tax=Sporosarcina limicola TaxID=34101 RepID=A0A927MMJ5_9BACL|nr:GGDEF domain-containing protein [Sporosarcina limicola]MBE1553946.1 diguanylate cyclase (GGDEF)-like protein [Sporosarcina limicola]
MVDSSSFDYYIQLYYVVTFVSVTLLVSRVMYKAFCDNYESNRRLKKEIETNHLLNQRLKEANQRLEIIASIDELTKISNRRGLHIHMDNLESNLNDNQQKFSSIVMDIDYFKKYNDYYGHNPGDKVLENIAGVLSGIAKDTSGFVARWGGEEFVYIICGENMEQIGSVCKRVQEAVYNLKIPHPQSEVSNYVTLSMGACSSNVSNRKEMQKCIEQADKALYNVKTGGRNGYSYVSMIVE